jgi:hypothetical protein
MRSRRKHVARNSLTRRLRARYPTCHVSHEFWFIWLILGLKIPLVGLFYFIFRVLRAQDKAWEDGELGGGWSEDDGGGGEPRVDPPPPPSGPGVRRRRPQPRAPQPAVRGLPLRRPPRRRAEPLRTRDPRPQPKRSTS